MSFDPDAPPCFFPNGTALPTTGFFGIIKPCAQSHLSSICCALNRDVPPGANITDFKGWAADECLPNGLCHNYHVKGQKKEQTFWLEYCTEKDLGSPRCLDICRHTRNADGGSVMTPCDGTATSRRWCCGSSKKCCTNDVDVVILDARFTGGLLEEGATKTSSTSSSSQTATSSAPESSITSAASGTSSLATAASAATSSPSQSFTPSRQNQDEGLSTGAKTGIGLGVALGVIAVLCLALFILRRKHKKIPSGYAQDLKNKEIYEHRWAPPPTELPTEGMVQELPSPPVELPGHEVGAKRESRV